MEWVLILTLVFSIESGFSSEIRTIDGFKNELSCTTAGVRWLTNTQVFKLADSFYTCVQRK